MRNRILTVAPVLVLSLMSISFSPVNAKEHGGNAELRAGIEAFQDGELDDARRLFLAAQAAGIDSRSLHYNLGVVYYQLGHYADARRHFETLTSYPEVASLAHYNLGLVALKQQQESEARQSFQRALELTGTENLRRLSLRQLELLGDATPPKAGYAAGGLALSAGYAENLSLLSEQAPSKPGDSFAEVFSHWSGTRQQGRDSSWRLEGSLYHRQYTEQTAFHQSSTYVGGHYEHAWGRTEGSVGVTAGSVYLGGDFAEWRTGPALALRQAMGNGWWRARWRYDQIFADELFQPYKGTQHLLDIMVARSAGLWDWQLELAFESNNRDDYNTDTASYSVSPHRYNVGAGLGRELSPGWWLGGELSHRFSNYPSSQEVDGSGVSRDGRKDQRTTVELDLGYTLSAEWRLFGQWLYQVNDSTLSAYDYQRHETQIGVEMGF